MGDYDLWLDRLQAAYYRDHDLSIDMDEDDWSDDYVDDRETAE